MAVSRRLIGSAAVLLGGRPTAVPVARSLSNAGVAVTALGASPSDPVRFSRSCQRYFAPRSTDRNPQETWLNWLEHHAGNGAVMFPCSDDGLELVARHGGRLRDLGYAATGDPRVILAMLDKAETYRLAHEAGIKTPRSVVVGEVEGLDPASADIPFPCAYKPVVSHQFARHFSEKALLVRDNDELRAAHRATSARGLKMMLTEIIPGGDDRLVAYVSYLGQDGQPLVEFTHRKLRQWPNSFGLASYAVSGWEPEVARLALSLLQHVGLRGVSHVEFKLDPRDDNWKLIECNHRFTIEFAGTANQLPVFVQDQALGIRHEPPPSPQLGHHLWDPIPDIRSFRSLHDRAELRTVDWLRSLQTPLDMHVFRADDPLPTIGYHIGLALDRTRKVLGRATAELGRPVIPEPRLTHGKSAGGRRKVNAIGGGTGAASGPVACVMGSMDLVRPLGLAGIASVVVAPPGDRTRFSRFTVGAVDGQADDLLGALETMAREQPEAPILYYQSDAALRFVSLNRRRLQRSFRFVVPDEEQVDTLLDKGRFARRASELGLPVPPSLAVDPAKQVPADIAVRFPLVIKAHNRDSRWIPLGTSVEGASDPSYSAKVLRVRSAGELEKLWGQLAASGLEFVLQEEVPGLESKVESYHAYIDSSGRVAGEFTGRKLRTLPPEHGFSTALTTTDSHDVTVVGRKVLEDLGFRGLAKLDFKRGPDGRLSLLEVNPRFSLWVHLGAVAGVNLAALVHADLAGCPRPAVAPARAGVRWCRPWKDFFASRATGVPFTQWLPWMLGCEANSAWAWDDPMPMMRGKLVPLARRVPAAARRGRRTPS